VGRRAAAASYLRTSNGTVCALIDSGFNGYLLWECRDGNLSDFPGQLTPLYRSVEIPGGAGLARLGVISIQWFQDIFIPVETLVLFVSARRASDTPKAYLGNALLSGMSLHIDFLNATLRIERSV